jgi:hypothetical protein
MGTGQESSWHGCARLGCVHRIQETWVPAQNWCSHPKLMKLVQIQQVSYRVEAWSTALPISHSAINFDADTVRLVMELSMGVSTISLKHTGFFYFFLKHNSRPNLTSCWHPPSQPLWQTPPFRLDSPGGRSLIFHRIRYSIRPDKIKGLVGGMLWITGKE